MFFKPLANTFHSLFSHRLIWVILSLVILIAVIATLGNTEDTVDIEWSEVPPALPIVSVESVTVGESRALVTAYTEIKPRWSIELKSEVAGTAVRVYNNAFEGRQIKKGDTVVKIDDTRYVAELAEAELSLRQARLAKEKANHATEIAKKQYSNYGDTPPNRLALHLPQLDIAASSMKAAEARVKLSSRNLEQTMIKAPFSGFVTERHINPGQTVMMGDPIVKIIANDVFELSASIDKSQWLLLDHPLIGQKATIYNEFGRPVGAATIREGGGYLNDRTRQYNLYLDVDGENSAVLVGDFVKVQIQGRPLSNTLNIAEASVTQEGYVWFVDSENRLTRYQANILFREQGRVVITAPGQDAVWQVVSTPISSYLPGLRVKPFSKEGA